VVQVYSNDTSPEEHPDLLNMRGRHQYLEVATSLESNTVPEAKVEDSVAAELAELLVDGFRVLCLQADTTPIECISALATHVSTEKRETKWSGESSDVTVAPAAVLAHV